MTEHKPGAGNFTKFAVALGAIAFAFSLWWLAAQLGLTTQGDAEKSPYEKDPASPQSLQQQLAPQERGQNGQGQQDSHQLPQRERTITGIDSLQVDRRPLDVVMKDRSDLRAMRQLQELRVRHDRGAGGYDRAYFGEPWADIDGNGCDTRNDILKRDLQDLRFRKGSSCVVSRGILHDPYVGVTIDFKRGPDTSPLVQIDHVVALGDAWRAGASEWSPAERQEFANDPNNLLAVEGQANQDKESSRADQWMPPREEYWCDYVTRQIDVKYEWDLTITEREREAMVRALSTCPG